MKNLSHLFFMLFCFCLPAMMHAQDKDEDNDDSEYLVGAVPEIDGKVVFTKEFTIPGMSQEVIHERALNWMEMRLKKNENTSRVVFTDKEKGHVVGVGDEWIVFSSSALSLDRTKILYQLTITSQPEKCVLEVEKIRFNYREGKDKYTAEEWIVDKYALNKAQDKLVRGLAKWRRKTVDFVDDLTQGLTESLSASTIKDSAKEEKIEKKIVASGPIVIAPKQAVSVNAPLAQKATPAQKVIAATALVPATPVAKSTPAAQTKNYNQIAPAQLPADAIQTGSGKLVIVIGEGPFNMTMMTANAGGSLGEINGKPVVFSILSPDQSHEQIEKADKYTVRFYPTGQLEPSIILECKKLPSPAAMEGMPRTYIGEILKVLVK